MRKALVCFVVLSALGVARAEKPETRFISVSGEGKVEVAPDMAVVSASASNVKKEAEEAYQATAQQINRLVAECKKLGVAEKDIQTTHISLNKNYRWVDNSQKFEGYIAAAYLKVTVRDMDKLNTLTRKVVESGANEINGIDYDHSKMEKLRQDAGVIALKKAKDEAKALCAEMGVKLGKVLTISSEGAGRPVLPSFGYAKAALTRSGGGDEMQAMPGLITVANSSTVTFEIE